MKQQTNYGLWPLFAGLLAGVLITLIFFQLNSGNNAAQLQNATSVAQMNEIASVASYQTLTGRVYLYINQTSYTTVPISSICTSLSAPVNTGVKK